MSELAIAAALLLLAASFWTYVNQHAGSARIKLLSVVMVVFLGVASAVLVIALAVQAVGGVP